MMKKGYFIEKLGKEEINREEKNRSIDNILCYSIPHLDNMLRSEVTPRDTYRVKNDPVPPLTNVPRYEAMSPIEKIAPNIQKSRFIKLSYLKNKKCKKIHRKVCLSIHFQYNENYYHYIFLFMSSLYDIEIQKTNHETITLESYRGKVLLIVNTATKCGLAPQFE